MRMLKDARISLQLPPADVSRLHLDAELDYLRVALQVGARRLERAGLLPGRPTTAADPFSRPPPADPSEVDAVSEAAAKRDALVARLVRDGEPPLVTLSTRLGLDDDDRLLMTVALASETAADFPAMFALFDPRGRDIPTLASVLMALVPPPRWFAVRTRLDPDHPLARHGLIVRDEGLEAPPGLHDAIRPSLRLLRIARGETGLDPTMAAYAELFPLDAETTPVVFEDVERQRFQRMREVVDFAVADPDRLPLLVLRGAGGAGRARWTREIGRHLGKATIVVDLHAAAMDARGTTERPPLAVALAAALREARVHDAVLALRNYERFAEPQAMGGGEEDESNVPSRAPTHHLSLRLEQCLAGHPNPVALLVPTDFADFPEVRRGIEIVDLPMPEPASLLALWRMHFPEAKLAADTTFDTLVSAFRLTPGELEVAAREGVRSLQINQAQGTPDARADMAMLQEIVKSQRRHRLRDIATLVTRGYRWEDLIAPPTVFAQLRELLSRYRHRHRVMEVWGLKRRFGEAQGISALFEGPPGTGKTMAANIVARELGLDLFQVDLSKVMSKYIGETEKHLATLFDEAERAQALILFDEADSLFAKRTEVKDSGDRHANLKVNYLLQRIERFSGIAVLTTNLPENFDEAFGRRVTVKVHFPKPDLEARKLLWRSMLQGLPQKLDEFDLNEVAREFELSGGLIRNSVLRAAFMAAAREVDIDYDLLEIAARIELKHQGKLMRGDPLKDLVERFDSGPRAGEQGGAQGDEDSDWSAT